MLDHLLLNRLMGARRRDPVAVLAAFTMFTLKSLVVVTFFASVVLVRL